MPDALDTAPAEEPVELIEAKAHLNTTSSDDDTLITNLIISARTWVENYLQRALITQTRSLYLDKFSNEVEVGNTPLQSVLAVTYTDTDGATQTLAASVYSVDTFSVPGKVRLAYNQSWPSTRQDANVVRIQYKAGYGDAAIDIPEPIKQAMLLLIGHWYENREPVAIGTTTANVPFTIESLLYPYRVIRF